MIMALHSQIIHVYFYECSIYLHTMPAQMVSPLSKGTSQGNEHTRKFSGNTCPQWSQLVEPFSDWPLRKECKWCAQAYLQFKKKKSVAME